MGGLDVDVLATSEREALIIERRASRVPFRTIGVELGISGQRVQQIFEAARDRIPAQRLADLRSEESELADRAIEKLLLIAEDERVSPRTRVEAWQAVRGWSESKRKLFGVDAPTRSQVSVVSQDTIEAEIARLTAEMDAADAQLPSGAVER